MTSSKFHLPQGVPQTQQQLLPNTLDLTIGGVICHRNKTTRVPETTFSNNELLETQTE